MNREVLDDIGRVISGAADTVSRKTGELVELTRLKNQVFNLEREIKRDYADLGKMIYEQYLKTGVADESLQPICQGITKKERLVEQYEGEIECLKKEH
ncbi:hypothetical protein [Candidatus Merdisoma sp. JLR.KK006]|jgi:hypothetical protein|uniref:hypothetical protein n=1 Tax=Candidatus Merdisoma sp. JLR.KK006 TaxID=3112626 RepID=UPI002FF4108C